MSLHAFPMLALALAVSVYWLCVARMVWRVRRRARGVRGVLIPSQSLERLMGVIWTPVIIAWLVLPWIAVARPDWLVVRSVLPAAASGHVLALAVRLGAAAVAIGCLLGSTLCWRHMGKHWRMAVDADAGKLFVNGPFAYVRHPIYALSILLMLCSALILPAAAMLVAAAVHILLMHLKARNEEAFLLKRHGTEYAAYCGRTGRFVPRGRQRITAA
ncbi:Isoprenylcysteine carboxyl methyltransferase (ICMT) family protein [Phycisphaerae bacterium RAS1]|nr:Isoprenylcysteine carboxyl methyltransferase (ICMT) family protein [Phycisphaerae bacterium RAS1]